MTKLLKIKISDEMFDRLQEKAGETNPGVYVAQLLKESVVQGGAVKGRPVAEGAGGDNDALMAEILKNRELLEALSERMDKDHSLLSHIHEVLEEMGDGYIVEVGSVDEGGGDGPEADDGPYDAQPHEGDEGPAGDDEYYEVEPHEPDTLEAPAEDEGVNTASGRDQDDADDQWLAADENAAAEGASSSKENASRFSEGPVDDSGVSDGSDHLKVSRKIMRFPGENGGPSDDEVYDRYNPSPSEASSFMDDDYYSDGYDEDGGRSGYDGYDSVDPGYDPSSAPRAESYDYGYNGVSNSGQFESGPGSSRGGADGGIAGGAVQDGRPAQSASPSGAGQNPRCPYCGNRLTYITEYDRHYCYQCARYPPESLVQSGSPSSQTRPAKERKGLLARILYGD